MSTFHNDSSFIKSAKNFLGASFLLGNEIFNKVEDLWVKDLENIGRDLKNVILLDHDRNSYQEYLLNTVPIKEFTGDDEDKELPDLIRKFRI